MLYDYECDNCGNYLNDIFQKLADKPLKKCPKCKKNKLRRVFFAAHSYVKGDPKTLGLLSKRNAESLGRYEKDKILHEQEQVIERRQKKMGEKLAKIGLSLPTKKTPDMFGELPKDKMKLLTAKTKKEAMENGKRLEKYIRTGE